MSRRRHKQLSPTRSSPAWDLMLRRDPSRRQFETLQPGGTVKAVPNPYLGAIYRYMKTEAVAEYKTFSGITTTAWNTGNFRDKYNGYAYSPVFTGDEVECYYYVMPVANESTDDLTVTMQPLRFSIVGCDAANDTFDALWNDWPNGRAGARPDFNILPVGAEGPLQHLYRTAVDTLTTHRTLLPISGNSHLSDNDPKEIYLYNQGWQYQSTIAAPGWRANAFHDLFGWNPTNWLNPNQNPATRIFPLNMEVSCRFAQLRKNGLPYLDVFDFEPWLQFKRNGNRTSPSSSLLLIDSFYAGVRFIQPGNAKTNEEKLLETSQQFEFSAGDTLDIDIWVQLKARPRVINGINSSTAQSANVLAIFPRRMAATGLYKNHYYLHGNPVTQAALPTFNYGILSEVAISGLISGSGWDFQNHTVSFDLQDSVWYPGSGAPGPRKAEEWVQTTNPSPTVAAVGTVCYGTGDGNVTPPAGTVSGQTLITIIETANQNITTPSGWALLKSAAGTGTSGDPASTRLTAFYKHITASETSNMTFTDPGTHWIAVMMSVNNANKVGPVAASSRTDQLATAGTSGALVGVATTSSDSLILLCGTNGFDSASSLSCTVTNGTLSGMNELVTTTQAATDTVRVRPSVAVSAVWQDSDATKIDDSVTQPTAGDGVYCYAAFDGIGVPPEEYVQQWNCGSPGDGGEIVEATLWLYLKFDSNSDGTISLARVRLNGTWYTVTLSGLPSSGSYGWASGTITGTYGSLTGSNPGIELTAGITTADAEVYLDVAYLELEYKAAGGSLTVHTGTRAGIGNVGDTTFDWSESGKQSMAMFELRAQPRIEGWSPPVIDTKSVRWSGRVQSGELVGAFAMFELSWQNEIATLSVQIQSGPPGIGGINSMRYLTYKPEDSGDYIHEFTDTEDGPLTMYETGCYNHLGTTRFVPYYGVKPQSFSPTLHYGLPSSIIVRKVNR